MLTEPDVTEALRACFDPATGKEVVESGVIANVRLTLDPDAPGAGIAGVPPRQCLLLTLSGKDEEDWRAMLSAQIRNRLAGIEGLSRVEIVWQPRLFRILP